MSNRPTHGHNGSNHQGLWLTFFFLSTNLNRPNLRTFLKDVIFEFILAICYSHANSYNVNAFTVFVVQPVQLTIGSGWLYTER